MLNTVDREGVIGQQGKVVIGLLVPAGAKLGFQCLNGALSGVSSGR